MGVALGGSLQKQGKRKRVRASSARGEERGGLITDRGRHKEVGDCDIPPLSKGGQSQPGSIRGVNAKALTHNTHIHGPNKELLYEFLSYKRGT
jgi:hypothetical protein